MKNYHLILKSFLLIVLFVMSKCYGQFTAISSTAYAQMLDSFVLSGVSVTNVTYTGSALSCGNFSNGNATNLGMNKGIVLTTGQVNEISNGFAYFGSSNMNGSGNTLLAALAGVTTNDAAVLEFDVVPANDTLTFSYIFGSEDYPENVGTSFIDPVAAFISGSNPSGGNYNQQNFALITNTNLPVNVNTINDTTNAQFFIKNTAGSSVMFDGFTKVLNAKIAVVPLASYHLTIAIADGGDYVFDSGIFLKGKSLTSYSKMNSGITNHYAEHLVTLCGNPLNENSRLDLQLGHSENTSVYLYDETGRLISTLLDQYLEAGRHSIAITSSCLQKGFYVLQSKIGNNIYSSKIIVN